MTVYNIGKILTLLKNMISAKIYFRNEVGKKGKKRKDAYINLKGEEIEQLKKTMTHGECLIVRLEDNGTKIVLKQEKSIKI